jgi:hypothetical protein
VSGGAWHPERSTIRRTDGGLGVLVPVRVDDVVVEGIFRTRTWIDLVGHAVGP